MADRNARFVREIQEADKRTEQYGDRLEQLFRQWLIPLLEVLDEGTEIRETALAQIRAGAWPDALDDQIDNVLELYVEELNNIKGRFALTQDDAEITEQIAALQAANIRADLVATATAIASAAAFAVSAGEPIRPTELINQYI